MSTYKYKYNVLYKAIAIALVCLFIANDIAWADPSSLSNSSQSSTLSPESRFKPFSEKHDIDLANIATAAYIAKVIKNMLPVCDPTPGQIRRFNQKFPNGDVVIDDKIGRGIFRCSEREYRYAVFNFKKGKETTTLYALFVDNLTDAERAELGIRDGEKGLIGEPRLAGVWFVKPVLISDGVLPQKTSAAAIEDGWDLENAATGAHGTRGDFVFEWQRGNQPDAGRVILEPRCPMRESTLLGRMNEWFYSLRGASTFSDVFATDVSSMISFAEQDATLFIALCDKMKIEGRLPERLYVYEFGPGNGNNAFKFLRYLRSDKYPEYYRRVKYRIFDASEKMIEDIKAQAGEYLDKFEFVKLDVTAGLPQLEPALLIRMNELLDDLYPTAMLGREESGKYYEYAVECSIDPDLVFPRKNGPALTSAELADNIKSGRISEIKDIDPSFLKKIRIGVTKQPVEDINAFPYGAVIAANFKDPGRFIMPVNIAACRFMEKLTGLLLPGYGQIVCRDYGTANYSVFRYREDDPERIPAARYGGQPTVNVNFPLIKDLLQAGGTQVALSEPRLGVYMLQAGKPALILPKDLLSAFRDNPNKAHSLRTPPITGSLSPDSTDTATIAGTLSKSASEVSPAPAKGTPLGSDLKTSLSGTVITFLTLMATSALGASNASATYIPNDFITTIITSRMFWTVGSALLILGAASTFSYLKYRAAAKVADAKRRRQESEKANIAERDIKSLTCTAVNQNRRGNIFILSRDKLDDNFVWMVDSARDLDFLYRIVSEAKLEPDKSNKNDRINIAALLKKIIKHRVEGKTYELTDPDRALLGGYSVEYNLQEKCYRLAKVDPQEKHSRIALLGLVGGILSQKREARSYLIPDLSNTEVLDKERKRADDLKVKCVDNAAEKVEKRANLKDAEAAYKGVIESIWKEATAESYGLWAAGIISRAIAVCRDRIQKFDNDIIKHKARIDDLNKALAAEALSQKEADTIANSIRSNEKKIHAKRKAQGFLEEVMAFFEDALWESMVDQEYSLEELHKPVHAKADEIFAEAQKELKALKEKLALSRNTISGDPASKCQLALVEAQDTFVEKALSKITALREDRTPGKSLSYRAALVEDASTEALEQIFKDDPEIIERLKEMSNDYGSLKDVETTAAAEAVEQGWSGQELKENINKRKNDYIAGVLTGIFIGIAESVIENSEFRIRYKLTDRVRPDEPSIVYLPVTPTVVEYSQIMEFVGPLHVATVSKGGTETSHFALISSAPVAIIPPDTEITDGEDTLFIDGGSRVVFTPSEETIKDFDEKKGFADAIDRFEKRSARRTDRDLGEFMYVNSENPAIIKNNIKNTALPARGSIGPRRSTRVSCSTASMRYTASSNRL
jgi:Uncharacterized conserved protein